MKSLTDMQLAFFVARVSIGINFLVHGVVRIPKLGAFAQGMTKGFEGTWLPAWSVTAFATALPFVEAVIGALLLVGLFTRWAATAGGLLIAVLMLGSGLKEDWPAVGTQTVYAIFFFLFISNLKHNALAIDSKKIAN